VKRFAMFDAALPGITPPPQAGMPSADAAVRGQVQKLGDR